jgi:hypothetical protein
MAVLRGLLPDSFDVVVHPHASAACPTTPRWVTAVVKSGTQLALDEVVIRAGHHFTGSINLDAFPSRTTARQAAIETAWFLISMLRPKVIGGKLMLSKPIDQDVQKLAIEILGAGASIELLRSLGRIDARSIKKEHLFANRFDFSARERSGHRRVRLEVKGTLNAASRSGHQKSITGKLATLPRRNYAAGIGVMFLGWSRKTPKKRVADFQISDPDGRGGANIDKELRALVRYYADAYELGGLPLASERLRALATAVPDLSRATAAQMQQYLGRAASVDLFARVRNEFRTATGAQVYGGAFFESRVRPWQGEGLRAQVNTDGLGYLFIGIHENVVALLRAGQQERLLMMKFDEALYAFELPVALAGGRLVGPEEPTYRGIARLTEDGVAYVWSNIITRDRAVFDQ